MAAILELFSHTVFEWDTSSFRENKDVHGSIFLPVECTRMEWNRDLVECQFGLFVTTTFSSKWHFHGLLLIYLDVFSNAKVMLNPCFTIFVKRSNFFLSCVLRKHKIVGLCRTLHLLKLRSVPPCFVLLFYMLHML